MINMGAMWTAYEGRKLYTNRLVKLLICVRMFIWDMLFDKSGLIHNGPSVTLWLSRVVWAWSYVKLFWRGTNLLTSIFTRLSRIGMNDGSSILGLVFPHFCGHNVSIHTSRVRRFSPGPPSDWKYLDAPLCGGKRKKKRKIGARDKWSIEMAAQRCTALRTRSRVWRCVSDVFATGNIDFGTISAKPGRDCQRWLSA